MKLVSVRDYIYSFASSVESVFLISLGSKRNIVISFCLNSDSEHSCVIKFTDLLCYFSKLLVFKCSEFLYADMLLQNEFLENGLNDGIKSATCVQGQSEK
jgi:hypothetical protein